MTQRLLAAPISLAPKVRVEFHVVAEINGKEKARGWKQKDAPLAQLAEQLTLNQWVPGSSPGGCTTGKTTPVCGNTNRGCFVFPLLHQALPLGPRVHPDHRLLSNCRFRRSKRQVGPRRQGSLAELARLGGRWGAIDGWGGEVRRRAAAGHKKARPGHTRPGPRLCSRCHRRLLGHVIHEGSGVAGCGGELAGELTHNGFEFLAQQFGVDRR